MRKRFLQPSHPTLDAFSLFDHDVNDMDSLFSTFSDTGDAVRGTISDDNTGKKVRKPYTITKSRESWTELEHDKFLEALQLYDRDWKKIEAFVGSKTVIQIRSHAQKYFLKVQKSGTNEHVPPPRPKKKATHPYPQKASKAFADPSQDSQSVLTNDQAWKFTSQYPSNAVLIPSPPLDLNVHRNNGRPSPVPDFSKVYSFIGSVFDPSGSNHLDVLKQMDPLNTETALLLMKNLTLNLKKTQDDGYS